MRRFNPPWKGLGVFPYNLRAGEELIIMDRGNQILMDSGNAGRRAVCK